MGDELPPRPIGPHTISGFITEVRAFNFTVWGSHVMEGQYFGADAGWLPELSGTDGDGSDSAMSMGPEEGPASGHTNLDKAKLIGLPRAYGYGSSMGTWVLDYLAYWAGNRGFIRHANIEYRFPVFEDDLAVLHGEVAEQRHEPILGVDLVAVDIRMVNQDDVLLARGRAEIEVPSG